MIDIKITAVLKNGNRMRSRMLQDYTYIQWSDRIQEENKMKAKESNEVTIIKSISKVM